MSQYGWGSSGDGLEWLKKQCKASKKSERYVLNELALDPNQSISSVIGTLRVPNYVQAQEIIKFIKQLQYCHFLPPAIVYNI